MSKKIKGFTLVEIVVTLFVFSIICIPFVKSTSVMVSNLLKHSDINKLENNLVKQVETGKGNSDNVVDIDIFKNLNSNANVKVISNEYSINTNDNLKIYNAKVDLSKDLNATMYMKVETFLSNVTYGFYSDEFFRPIFPTESSEVFIKGKDEVSLNRISKVGYVPTKVLFDFNLLADGKYKFKYILLKKVPKFEDDKFDDNLIFSKNKKNIYNYLYDQDEFINGSKYELNIDAEIEVVNKKIKNTKNITLTEENGKYFCYMEVPVYKNAKNFKKTNYNDYLKEGSYRLGFYFINKDDKIVSYSLKNFTIDPINYVFLFRQDNVNENNTELFYTNDLEHVEKFPEKNMGLYNFKNENFLLKQKDGKVNFYRMDKSELKSFSVPGNEFEDEPKANFIYYGNKKEVSGNNFRLYMKTNDNSSTFKFNDTITLTSLFMNDIDQSNLLPNKVYNGMIEINKAYGRVAKNDNNDIINVNNGNMLSIYVMDKCYKQAFQDAYGGEKQALSRSGQLVFSTWNLDFPRMQDKKTGDYRGLTFTNAIFTPFNLREWTKFIDISMDEKISSEKKVLYDKGIKDLAVTKYGVLVLNESFISLLVPPDYTGGKLLYDKSKSRAGDRTQEKTFGNNILQYSSWYNENNRKTDQNNTDNAQYSLIHLPEVRFVNVKLNDKREIDSYVYDSYWFLNTIKGVNGDYKEYKDYLSKNFGKSKFSNIINIGQYYMVLDNDSGNKKAYFPVEVAAAKVIHKEKNPFLINKYGGYESYSRAYREFDYDKIGTDYLSETPLNDDVRKSTGDYVFFNIAQSDSFLYDFIVGIDSKKYIKKSNKPVSKDFYLQFNSSPSDLLQYGNEQKLSESDAGLLSTDRYIRFNIVKNRDGKLDTLNINGKVKYVVNESFSSSIVVTDKAVYRLSIPEELTDDNIDIKNYKKYGTPLRKILLSKDITIDKLYDGNYDVFKSDKEIFITKGKEILKIDRDGEKGKVDLSNKIYYSGSFINVW